jgi:MFS family permease
MSEAETSLPAAGVAETGAVAAAAESRNPFRTARYRTWWATTICGAMGVGIQIVTVPLFVRDRVSEDHRAVAIMAALLCQLVPGAFLMLVGGVVADRVERRRILTRVYAVAAVASLAYVVISGLDVRQVWPVFILAAVIGSADAFNQPARLSMAPHILPRAQIQNGIILGMVAFMASFQLLGPAVGGFLADGPGLTVAFTAEVCFLVAAALLATRIGTDRPVPTGRTIFGDLSEGLDYVRRSRTLPALLFMQLLPGLLLIGPFRETQLLLVEDVLEASRKWIGLLSAGFGLGVLSGSIIMTFVRIPRRGLILCASPLLGGVIFVLYGLSEARWLSLAAMVPWGWSAAIFINMVTPLLQEQSSPAMLGRVMSMSNLAFAVSIPLGVAHATLFTNLLGPQEAVIIRGAAFAALGLVCLLFLRPVRRLM